MTTQTARPCSASATLGSTEARAAGGLSELTTLSLRQTRRWIGWTGVAEGYGVFGRPPAEIQPPTD